MLMTSVARNLTHESPAAPTPAAGWLADLRVRVRARMRGRLPEIRAVSELAGLLMWLRYRLPRGSAAARLASLLLAFRRPRTPLLLGVLRRSIRPWLTGPRAAELQAAGIGWHTYEWVRRDAAMPTTLVLKEPRPNGEKGVLYVSFEYNLMRLLAHHDARRLFADYVVVGASSWSPTDFSVFANYAGLSDDPLFMCISNLADPPVYHAFRPVVEAVPILASEWINPAFYDPKPHGEREIDILMVANWLSFKRHWLLFTALRRMRRDLRVVLVGIAGPNRVEQDVRDEARAFGVRQDLEFVTNVPIETVTALQCNARTAVLFSRREGSCVATAESLFAGSPVAMCRDAHVGSKAYINDRTGILVRERGMARALSAFLERSAEYRPREWALANISCHRTSERLNTQLRDYYIRTGKPWTVDITPMCWRYVPAYVRPEDEAAMEPAVERLRRDHGVALKKFEYKPSAASGGRASADATGHGSTGGSAGSRR